MTINSPKVYRGIPMDQQTQVGYFGTQLQVLKQQGYAVDEELSALDFYIFRQSLPDDKKGRDVVICPNPKQSSLPLGHFLMCKDEETDEDLTSDPLLLPGEDI
jgi:hypothetical protein